MGSKEEHSKEEHRATFASEAAGQCVCETVNSLLPLYTDLEVDSPENVLGSYPNVSAVVEAHKTLIDVMLPGKMTHGTIEPEELGVFLLRRLSHAWRTLRPELERALPLRKTGAANVGKGGAAESALANVREDSVATLKKFFATFPRIRELLVEDVRAAYNGDPAVLSYAEVKLSLPGVLAIASHRLAHELYKLDVPLIPRVMSEWTHTVTGVDLHPGAKIGREFFIDHATGVVIGETTEIGDRVKLYQGVTLGAKSFQLDEHGRPVKRVKRHPTVEDDVVIYANANILGGETVIGAGSTIGGNVFLMKSVPPKSFVVNKDRELFIKENSR